MWASPRKWERLRAENTELGAKNAELAAKLQAMEPELESLRREMATILGTLASPVSDTLADRAEQAEERLSRAESRRMAREMAKKFFKERTRRRQASSRVAWGEADGHPDPAPPGLLSQGFGALPGPQEACSVHRDAYNLLVSPPGPTRRSARRPRPRRLCRRSVDGIDRHV